MRTSGALLLPHWRAGTPALLSLLPTIAYTIAFPLALKLLIDEAIPAGDGSRAAALVAAMLGLLALCTVGDALNHYFTARVVADVLNSLRLRLFSHLQELSLSFYAGAHSGQVFSRYVSGTEALEEAARLAFSAAPAPLLTIVAGTIVLVAIDWRLALISALLAPIVFIAPRRLAPRVAEASYRRQADASRLATTLQENLAAQLVVKAFGLRDLALAQFGADLRQLRRSTTRQGFLTGIFTSALQNSASALLLIALSASIYLALQGELSVGAIVAFFELLWLVVTALQSLADLASPFQRAATGLIRIQELLDVQPEVTDTPGAVELAGLTRDIHLNDVCFAYVPERPVLDHVQLTIPVGQSIAFVGPSGCGKTTLLSLLMRYYDPTKGSIAIDGRDVRTLTQASLRAQIGAVFQDSFLFDTTIRENIRLGKPGASDTEVEAAALAAEIHGAILRMPAGYDTPVGERGGQLSGGQRQRVALARALIRNPQLLVFDEATSALDPQTEAAINATLERIAGSRTTLTVTHRLGSVVHADRIVVLDEGRVVEQGSHRELLDRRGMYYQLWRRQSGFSMSGDGMQAEVDPTRLSQIPLFANLDHNSLEAIADRFTTETYNPGYTVCEEGEVGLKLYILVRGRVEVLKRVADGDVRRLAVLEDGDFFGEIALLETVPRTATVRTLTPCVLLALDQHQFTTLLRVAPGLRAVFEHAAAERRREIDALIGGATADVLR